LLLAIKSAQKHQRNDVLSLLLAQKHALGAPLVKTEPTLRCASKDEKALAKWRAETAKLLQLAASSGKQAVEANGLAQRTRDAALERLVSKLTSAVTDKHAETIHEQQALEAGLLSARLRRWQQASSDTASAKGEKGDELQGLERTLAQRKEALQQHSAALAQSKIERKRQVRDELRKDPPKPATTPPKPSAASSASVAATEPPGTPLDSGAEAAEREAAARDLAARVCAGETPEEAELRERQRSELEVAFKRRESLALEKQRRAAEQSAREAAEREAELRAQADAASLRAACEQEAARAAEAARHEAERRAAEVRRWCLCVPVTPVTPCAAPVGPCSIVLLPYGAGAVPKVRKQQAKANGPQLAPLQTAETLRR
jgi:hypothetical protein